MQQVSKKTLENVNTAPGTVEVTRAIPASAAEVWQSLTEPETVAKWFGELSSPLSVDKPSRLEFGDGDFFFLFTIQIKPPTLLQYSWRFLGTGPLDTITWRVVPAAEGCLVTVTDHELLRTGEEARAIRKGWLDFTHRLEKFHKKGKPTRYPWRHEFDGSIELSGPQEATWNMLFEPRLQSVWLPLKGSDLESGASFHIDDGAEPVVFGITNVKLDSPDHAQFDVTHEEWLHATSCNIELSPRGDDLMLSVSHNGWQSISRQTNSQKRQRTRFCNSWIASLLGARQLIG